MVPHLSEAGSGIHLLPGSRPQTMAENDERWSVAHALDADLAECFALRHEVFVLEQGVARDLELDGLDASARHWIARCGESIVGTARARTIGRDAKAERVAVRSDRRGAGVGRGLMTAIEAWARTAGLDAVRLNAQADAVPFYEGLGYAIEGPEFEEAGIPHRSMRKML
jgi:predicted GNAT family N-acyltransferase